MDYEQTVTGIASDSDSRIMKRLREQQRQIELQQQEIDQVRYEKELLKEETKRLRAMTNNTAVAEIQRARRKEGCEPRALPQLHSVYEAKNPALPLEGTRDPVRFGQLLRQPA